MSDSRPVSIEFLQAMEAGLEHGRQAGRVDWDNRWATYYSLIDLRQHLRAKFLEEVSELIMASLGRGGDLMNEAADVANLAMMIADIGQEEGE